MTKLLPGVRREDLVAAADPSEGLRIARKATRQLKDWYGDRLVDVIFFGSWLRGEAHEESDVDLLVIFDELQDRVAERNRMVDILFDLEVDSHRAIEAFPVAERDARPDAHMFVGRALREGRSLLREPS
jgi:predicted nucleotidyltransferase